MKAKLMYILANKVFSKVYLTSGTEEAGGPERLKELGFCFLALPALLRGKALNIKCQLWPSG